MFYNNTLNNIFQHILTITYGHPVTLFISSHNISHHKYVQTTKDIFRTTKVQYRWNILNLLLFYNHIVSQILKNDYNYIVAQKKLGRPVFKQFLSELIFMIAHQGVMFYLNWKFTILFLIIPYTFAKWGIISLSLYW
jgi:hypothetical protein